MTSTFLKHVDGVIYHAGNRLVADLGGQKVRRR